MDRHPFGAGLIWYASNNWAGKDWCENECLDNLLKSIGTEDPEGTIVIAGNEAMMDSLPGVGRIVVNVAENNGGRDRYCGFKDVMTVGFGFSSNSGLNVEGDDFVLCGDAASGFSSFQPAQGEYGYLRRRIYGDGWYLMGYVYGATRTRTVPEPGTLAILAGGLVGLGLSRRRRGSGHAHNDAARVVE